MPKQIGHVNLYFNDDWFTCFVTSRTVRGGRFNSNAVKPLNS